MAARDRIMEAVQARRARGFTPEWDRRAHPSDTSFEVNALLGQAAASWAVRDGFQNQFATMTRIECLATAVALVAAEIDRRNGTTIEAETLALIEAAEVGVRGRNVDSLITEGSRARDADNVADLALAGAHLYRALDVLGA